MANTLHGVDKPCTDIYPCMCLVFCMIDHAKNQAQTNHGLPTYTFCGFGCAGMHCLFYTAGLDQTQCRKDCVAAPPYQLAQCRRKENIAYCIHVTADDDEPRSSKILNKSLCRQSSPYRRGEYYPGVEKQMFKSKDASLHSRVGRHPALLRHLVAQITPEKYTLVLQGTDR